MEECSCHLGLWRTKATCARLKGLTSNDLFAFINSIFPENIKPHLLLFSPLFVQLDSKFSKIIDDGNSGGDGDDNDDEHCIHGNDDGDGDDAGGDDDDRHCIHSGRILS